MLRDLLDEYGRRLGSPTEARWMAEQATRLEPGALLAHLGDPVADDVRHTLDSWVVRRESGEPLQYVLGSWPFRSLELAVDRRVLIPRPETETVVGIALDVIGATAGEAGADRVRRVVDLGTGSGAIALSLAAEGPVDLEVWATDRSSDALAVARANLAALARHDQGAARRVRLALGSWFDALPATLIGTLSLVVSNPPYVSEAEWTGLDPVVRDHEPRRALVAGVSGLESIVEIVTRSRRWLVTEGCIVIALAPHQADTAVAAAAAAGYIDVRVEEDLTGRDRALVASWPGS